MDSGNEKKDVCMRRVSELRKLQNSLRRGSVLKGLATPVCFICSAYIKI